MLCCCQQNLDCAKQIKIACHSAKWLKIACHVLYQEIADNQEIVDVLAGLGHLEGLPVENQEFADFLAGL